MSEIKIQESSPDYLAGGQTPEQALAADLRSRQGHNCPQNTMSICRGQEVAARSETTGPNRPGLVNGVFPANRPSDLNAGLSVSGRAQESARPVDRRTIEGSTPGDSRAKGSPAVLPTNPGPRAAKS